MNVTLTVPGDDVEAWCTRCRMNLNHRVIAVVGNEIKRVQCLTCGGDHIYRPPKNEHSAAESDKETRQHTRKPSGKANSRSAGEWARFMQEMPPETTPRPYRISEAYQPGEFIAHPVFGTGRVLEIVAREKVQVVFKEGRKILLCNKKST